MPCRDDGVPSNAAAQLEAMLCGVVHVLDKQNCLNQILDHVDWVEAGITRYEFDRWWRMHQQQDEERRNRELWEQQKIELRNKTLARLSPAERQALGFE